MKIVHSFTDAAGRAHTIKAVHAHPINNGQISVKLRCCDDSQTDHHHTVQANVSDPAAVLTSITEAAKFVGNQHANMMAAQALIQENFLEESSDPKTGHSMRRLD